MKRYMIPAGTLVHPIYVLGGWENALGQREYRIEPAHENMRVTTINWFFTDDDIITAQPRLQEAEYVDVLLHNDIANMMLEPPPKDENGIAFRYANAFTAEWCDVVKVEDENEL